MNRDDNYEYEGFKFQHFCWSVWSLRRSVLRNSIYRNFITQIYSRNVKTVLFNGNKTKKIITNFDLN